MNRRNFLTGMAGILASGFAPAALPSGIIMPIRKIWTPSVWDSEIFTAPKTGIYQFSASFVLRDTKNHIASAKLVTPSREYVMQKSTDGAFVCFLEKADSASLTVDVGSVKAFSGRLISLD